MLTFIPLLLIILFHNVAIAFSVAITLFGASHAYQGRVGMLATFIAGVILFGVYAVTENLFIVMGLHFIINFRSLVLVPVFGKLLAKPALHR